MLRILARSPGCTRPGRPRPRIIASHNPAGKTFSQRLLRFSARTGKIAGVLRFTSSRLGRDELDLSVLTSGSTG